MAAPTPQQIVEELQQKLVSLSDEMKTLQARADAEKRPMTDQEDKDFTALVALFQETDRDIKRRETSRELEAKLEAPAARIVRETVAATETTTTTTEPPRRGATSMTARTVETVYPHKGTGGFRGLGDYALSVWHASAKGAQPDQRLTMLNAATTLGSESAGADGGFAVPPDFRSDIIKLIMAEDTLLGRTDQQVTSSNTLVVPTDETTAWQTTGGIQAYWEGENQQLTQAKPQLKNITVRAHKLTALVPVTDELLEDASSMANYLRTKTPDKINFKVNDALVNGSGSGMPMGVMNAAAKVTVSKESGQAASTVVFANINKMWSRMYAPYRSNAVWLINQDVEPQLQNLQISGSNSGVFPAYLPPGGLSGSPYSTLLGRPIIVTEACQGLTTEGDIILWAPDQYLSLTKGGGVRQDISIHLWFDYDVTAFRWILRLGGQPWLSTAISRKNGSNTLSSIVTLQSR